MEDPLLARSHDTARAVGNGMPTSAEALGGLIEGALAAAMQRQAAANGTRSYSNAVLPTPAQLVGASIPAHAPLPTAMPAVSAGNSGIADEDEEPGSPWADGGKGGHGETKNSNRKLSSRFRGVCWNKKNKRWQSAINSGGRYLYLGSYTNEDDAARAFDKAAIKIRGRKAKLNFTYDDYTDENGDFIDDIVLPDPPAAKASKRKTASVRNDAAEQLQLLAGQLAGNRVVTDGDGAVSSSGGRNARFGVYGESFNAAFRNAAAMLQPAMLQPARPDGLGSGANAAGGFGAASAGQAVRGYLQDAGLLVRMGNGSTSQQGQYEAPLSVGQLQGAPPNLHEVVRQLPPNCSVDDVLPGNESVFGIIYKHEASEHTGARGCAVWNGASLNDDGMYNSERDARQSCAAAVAALMGRGGGQAAWQQQQAQQQRRATALDGLSNLGIVEALALAARAATEEAGQDSHGNGAPSDGGDGAAPSSSAPARASNGGDGRSSDDGRGRAPFGSSSGDGRGGDPYGSSYGGGEYAPARSSFRRRSGSQSLDNAPDAPAPKRARVDPDGPATAAGARDPSGMPPLGPTATAALQGGAGGGGSGSGGSALSAMERLCNLNLTDMLRQMAQAAAARGSSAAADALEDALAGPQQQQHQPAASG